MAWKKDEDGEWHWITTLAEQWEDDTLTNIRICELIMTEIISNRGRDGEKSYEDARQLDEILRHVYDVDTSDLERAFNYYRSQIGWYTILEVDPHSVAKVQDQELKPESQQDESADDNRIVVHDEDTDIADNPLADDWMTNVMNEVMKFNHDHGRDDDKKGGQDGDGQS